MTAVEREFPLTGGRVTPGVVRVGPTVRRPPTANSDFVRRLLAHLAVHGFDAAPLPLGVDDRGRDVLTFIDGDVPGDLGWHGDATLRDAALLIRRFHDLTAALASPAGEVICHNDLSPCNFVFRDGRPVAMIDFDAAAPGRRLDDLGYAAWLWLDLGAPEISAAEQSRRLAAFVAAYGLYDPGLVLAAAVERQAILAADGERTGNGAMARWAADCEAWTRRHIAALSRG